MPWWQDYFNCVDSLEPKQIQNWFAEEINLQFGNTPIKGRDAAIAAIEGFISQLKGMKHNIGEVLEIGNKIFVDAVVGYHFNDGRVLNIPAGTYMEYNDGKISDLRVYIDLSPVYAG